MKRTWYARRGAGGRRNGRNRGNASGPYALALLLVILATALVIGVSEKAREARARPPYGTPEYVIEVPPGYEGLLPPDTAVQADRADRADAASGADASAGAQDRGAGLPARAAPPASSPAAQPSLPRAAPPARETLPPLRADGTRGVLAVVIDDAGYDLRQLRRFLDLPFPLGIAVLPGLPRSAEAAKAILDSGKELLLHQPMEALGGQNPGPGAITLDMSPDQARDLLAKNLDSLPGAAGVNNHMGSAVTRNAELTRAVVELAKERGIYYLDSRTTPDTLVRKTGLGLGISTRERDVFLDNSGDRDSIVRALSEGKKLAAYKGSAILIGHVWSSELASTLMEFYPQLVAEGYSLSTISRLMMIEAHEEETAGNAPVGN